MLNENDVVFIVAHPAVQEPIIALLGEQVEMDWEQFGNELITRRILITKPGINGKTISQMQIRSNLGTNSSRPRVGYQPYRECTWQPDETTQLPQPDTNLLGHHVGMYRCQHTILYPGHFRESATRTDRRSAHRGYPDRILWS